MKFGMLLTTSPEKENSETLIKLAHAALDSGHEVAVFLMDDGVYNVVNGVDVSTRFAGLTTKGASLALCAHTAELRGVKREDFIEGVSFGGQYDLAIIANEADRFLTFGG